MRIISGTFKSKLIKAPKSLPVRPTTDFAKEGLFNILRNRFAFSEIQFLDLFAGTGNISYEMASRGTQNSWAVDSDLGCIQFIKKIADELGFSIIPVKSDVYHFLEKTHHKFDVIFADPPYNFTQDQFEKITTLVFEKNLLALDGLLIIEHSKHTSMNTAFNFVESRRYGGSVFSFFANKT